MTAQIQAEALLLAINLKDPRIIFTLADRTIVAAELCRLLDRIAELEALQAAPPAPAAVAVPDDLKARCAEILGWQWTGILTGNALRDFAAAHYSEHHDALQMAERTTAREAYAALVAAPAQAVGEKVYATFEAWGKAVGGDFARHECGPYVAKSMELAGMAWREAASAQEHATQLAGQDWDRIKGGLSILMLGFAKRTSPTTLKAAEAVLDAATEPGAPLAMLRAAAPAQVQEGA